MNNVQSPRADDDGIEQAIKSAGADVAPRVTPTELDAAIVKAEHHRLTGTLTVCVLTLRNGFTVTGESACASPENFDAAIGQRIAYANAREKLWPLMGYALKERLYEAAKIDAALVRAEG